MPAFVCMKSVYLGHFDPPLGPILRMAMVMGNDTAITIHAALIELRLALVTATDALNTAIRAIEDGTPQPTVTAYSVAEAARLLGVSSKTLHRLGERLPRIETVSGMRRVPAAWVHHQLSAQGGDAA